MLRFRPRSARLAASVVACLVLAGFAPVAAASTGSRLSQANGRAARLAAQMAAAQAAAAKQQANLQRVLARLSVDESSYQTVQSRVMNTRASLAAVQQRYEQERAAIDQRAAEAYMQGPGAAVEAVLSSGSFAELNDRLQFESAVSLYQIGLADQADRTRTALAGVERRQSALLEKQAKVVRITDQQRQNLALAFAAEQSALDQLVGARARALRQVKSLKQRLALEHAAAGTGSPITYGGWAAHLLSALGDATSQSNLVVLVAWQAAEGTMATWNPLATTYDMPGATTFNSVGVKNYPSLAVGIRATIDTLRAAGHGYEQILAGLAASSDPMTTADAINASDWCHGCAGGQYVVDLVPVVEQYYGTYANR